jgi:transcriptional regulator with XRE-family HTH domain
MLAALGGRVRTHRGQRQLTQQALARKLGLSVAYVSLIERGHRNPPFLRRVRQITCVP